MIRSCRAVLAAACLALACGPGLLDPTAVRVWHRPTLRDSATIARMASVPVSCAAAADIGTWPERLVPGTALSLRLPPEYQPGGAPRPSATTAGWSAPGGAFVLLEAAAGTGSGGNEIIIDPADERTVFVYESVCGFASAERPLAARRFLFAAPAPAPARRPAGDRYVYTQRPAAFAAEAALVIPGGGRAAGAIFARTEAERDRLLAAMTSLRVSSQ